MYVPSSRTSSKFSIGAPPSATTVPAASVIFQLISSCHVPPPRLITTEFVLELLLLAA